MPRRMLIAAAGLSSSRIVRQFITLIGKSAIGWRCGNPAVKTRARPEMTSRVADTATLPVDTTEKVQSRVFDW